MCLVRRYSRWQCGCPVPAEDQAMTITCEKKLANLQGDCPGTRDMWDEGENWDFGDAYDIDSDEEEDDDDNEDEDDEAEEQNGGSAGCAGASAQEVTPKRPAYYSNIISEAFASYEQDMALRLATAPRMCPDHEAKLERACKSHWNSEMQWLRPKLAQHGEKAHRDLDFAVRCADRLSQLYHVWKYTNGGDARGEEIAALAEFRPLHHKKYKDIDSSYTMQYAFGTGVVSYNALRRGINDILETLRDHLHPREMGV